jgi:hypothetical protein
MAYVFTALVALILGVALAALCRAIRRRRMGAPLPLTRHPRRVRMTDQLG